SVDRALHADLDSRRAALRHRLRRHRARGDGKGGVAAGVARPHGPGSHPPPLRGARPDAAAERPAHLFHLRPPRAFGDAPGARQPARGDPGLAAGGLRAGHRRGPRDGGPRSTGMMPAWRRLAARLRALLELGDPPPRIALSLAVGVFMSCTPFLGVQTLLSLVIAIIFRLNRAAAIAGTWLNLPWVMPLVYGAPFQIATLLFPDP